ncbi:MAG TPA: hypothetical protein PLD20_00660 [Blastocatellia bacterium]|nr:hypothetical protein [Blastocatellia bacterium]HMV85417.1 hypothetical protein [Blastocatellia bacterium]HMX26858.1 hypothetical protein [Blastocatellia bacterium]HMY71534.1 hypothetical protein [Blastocatellia bacterium]HMZ16445.1 hypothetical protein [Blastocatellia bacterium]
MFTNPPFNQNNIGQNNHGRTHNGAGNRRWLGFELSVLRRLKFSSIAIPFAGQPDLGWYLKFWGKQVLDNDLCQWAWWVSRALVENPGETLTEEDVSLVLSESYVPHRRLHNAALGAMMSEMDAVWFDNIWLNIQQIENEHRRALAILLAMGVGDYVFSFTPETAELRRPLSEVFLALWRNQRRVVDNGKENYSVNRDAHDFIRGARADLMFVRFPRPEGLAALRNSVAGWRETWVRGTDEAWDRLIASQRGRLGDDVASKEHYLQLVGNFLSRAKHIPQWAIAHTEDGFLNAAEMGNVIKQFRRVEVTYNKDFSDVIGGKNTFLIVA